VSLCDTYINVDKRLSFESFIRIHAFNGYEKKNKAKINVYHLTLSGILIKTNKPGVETRDLIFFFSDLNQIWTNYKEFPMFLELDFTVCPIK
jgi:hypothetical protein